MYFKYYKDLNARMELLEERVKKLEEDKLENPWVYSVKYVRTCRKCGVENEVSPLPHTEFHCKKCGEINPD